MLASTEVEAGRGCIGGSMFFAGAKLKTGIKVEDIAFADDSKKTTPKKREEWYNKLQDLIDVKVVRKTAQDIDKDTLAECLRDSVQQIRDWSGETPVIYDGSTNYKVQGVETLVKADAKISLVSAASIIAKFLKDKESVALTEKYPEFNFAGHKGYINKKHTQEIIDNGFTKHHRQSYNVKALQGVNLPIYDEK